MVVSEVLAISEFLTLFSISSPKCLGLIPKSISQKDNLGVISTHPFPLLLLSLVAWSCAKTIFLLLFKNSILLVKYNIIQYHRGITAQMPEGRP